MGHKASGVRLTAACLAVLSNLPDFRPAAAETSDYRPAAWRVELRHVGETLPSDWSPPAGQTILEPFAMPASWVTVRVAFEVGNEADCPERVFAFHASRVGIDLSAPSAGIGMIYSNQAQAQQNVHLLTLQTPRCRLALRVSKAIRDGDGAWHRVAVWSQTDGPGPFPSEPKTDVADPDAREAAHERFTVERRAWEKRLFDWHTPRRKAVMDEMRQRDPARAAAIEEGRRTPPEFSGNGYVDWFGFTDTVEPCFEANGYMVVGPSGVQLAYRPQFERADPQAPPSGSEPLVPFGTSVTYDDANTAATVSLYSPTCRLEIGIGEEIRTTRGWVSAPMKRSF